MLTDPENEHIVSFDESGVFLMIHDPYKIEQILPNYFKHNNYSSLVRQLHAYGFRKLRNCNVFFKYGFSRLLLEGCDGGEGGMTAEG